ncbi:MAG: response regulator, partial [Paludibacter sp.]
LRIISNFLKDEGYKIALALDGNSALKILEDNSIDLILLDIMMPEIDGFEVCKRVKANPKTKEIPITIVSETKDLFLHLFTPQTAKFAKGGTAPAFPAGNISFLNGISAIGTKFTKPEVEGPQSGLNEYLPNAKPLSGKLIFRFGE